MSTGHIIQLPLLDYRFIEAYAPLATIEPSGYFALGRRYVHAPRVEWKPVDGAVRYELLLLQGESVLGVTPAVESPCYIAEGWGRITPGKANVAIQAFGVEDKRIALSRLFPIYVAPDYNHAGTAAPRRAYIDAAWLAFDALYHFQFPPDQPMARSGPIAGILPLIRAGIILSDGHTDARSFPSLHNWLHMCMLENLMPLADQKRQGQILRYARSVGDHLLLCRLPEGHACAGMMRGCCNIDGGPALGYADAEGEYAAKMQRVVEPGKTGLAAEALVKVFEMLEEEPYLDAALVMAEYYVKTQRPDGSWPARVDGLTGEVLGDYATSAVSVASFLERLARHRPDARWDAAREKAVAWMMRYPMRTFAWVTNYDDFDATATLENPYKGLCNWDLFQFIRYLCAHPDIAPNTVEAVCEQFNWNDNQFCLYGSDPLFPYETHYPVCIEQSNPGSFCEETRPWIPMDFHTAHWASAMLAYYRLTKDEHWLERTRAAANAVTQYQLDNGYTITWMGDKAFGLSALFAGRDQTFWPAAWAACAALWAELARME